MALRNLLHLGDNTLRKKSKPVTSFDAKLSELIDDMIETMHKNNGMGLAAVQCGVLKRVCIVETEDALYELVNPTLVSSSGKVIDQEGCLSVEGFHGIVERPEHIVVDYFDRKGEKHTVSAEGYPARAFLHEMDHLDGILFVDKMIRKATKKELEQGYKCE